MKAWRLFAQFMLGLFVMAALLLVGPSLTNAAGVRFDPAFGTGGVALLPQLEDEDIDPFNLAIQADGKIVVLGRRWPANSSQWDLLLARLWPDGTLDTSFGAGGRVFFSFGLSNTPADLVLQDDGKIVVISSVEPYFDYYEVAQAVVSRFNTDGTLDTTFGDGGKQFMLSADASRWLDVTLQPDGKILATGRINDSLCVVRYTATGAEDTTFNNGSAVSVLHLPYGARTEGQYLGLDSQGRIIVVAHTRYEDFSSDITLARFNSDGTLDSAFNALGYVTVDLAAGSTDYSRGLVLDTEERIYLAFTALYGGLPNKTAILARLTPSGQLDAAFNGTGWATSMLPEESFGTSGLTLDSEGRPVMVGTFGSGEFLHHAWLMRFTTAGEADSGFGVGGLMVVGVGVRYLMGQGVLNDAQGRILCTGRASFTPTDPNDLKPIVTRYCLGGSLTPASLDLLLSP